MYDKDYIANKREREREREVVLMIERCVRFFQNYKSDCGRLRI